jgi:hypothetical protein
MGIANYRHRTKLIVAIFVLYIFVLFCGATGPSSSSASSRGDLSNPPSGMEYEYVIERAEPKHAPELRSLIQVF